jgi:archaellum biogenesis ATPase FlaH
MAQMIADDTARGAVVILDTLKKFVDPMDKKSGREFMTSAREFVSNGGTLIMLACQTAWKNGQGIRENSVENCPP